MVAVRVTRRVPAQQLLAGPGVFPAVEPAIDQQPGMGIDDEEQPGNIGIDRKRARPYDGHGRHRPGSLLAIGAKRGEEGSLTFNGDTREM